MWVPAEGKLHEQTQFKNLAEKRLGGIKSEIDCRRRVSAISTNSLGKNMVTNYHSFRFYGRKGA